MGYYVETGTAKNKTALIVKAVESAYEASYIQAAQAVAEGRGVIIVVDNGTFEAAAFAYSDQEFREFTEPSDPRPKRYVVMDLLEAERISGYAR